jgi:histidinol-phosphate aminotransferase
MAFCEGGVVFPDITYGFYEVYANLYNLDYKKIPLKDDFSIDVNDYIGKGKNIVIANPNAPTGLLIPFEDVERIVASNPDNLVIMDEAYIAFGGKSCMKLVKKYDNLLVTRTFSKSHSLAGLRVGFGIGSKEIIEDMNKLKYSFNPYNLNTLSIKAAAAAIADNEYYNSNIAKIIENREWTTVQLKALGFECTDSMANFIFASHCKIPASEIAAELRKRKILVRYFNKAKIDNYLRITVGSAEEMQTLVEAIKEITA